LVLCCNGPENFVFLGIDAEPWAASIGAGTAGAGSVGSGAADADAADAADADDPPGPTVISSVTAAVRAMASVFRPALDRMDIRSPRLPVRRRDARPLLLVSPNLAASKPATSEGTLTRRSGGR